MWAMEETLEGKHNQVMSTLVECFRVISSTRMIEGKVSGKELVAQINRVGELLHS